jgi:hypothetical protein
MLPSASEQRVRTPLVKSSSSGSWVIAGYSVDYALDWALVVVMGVVLAASEAGVPREGELVGCVGGVLGQGTTLGVTGQVTCIVCKTGLRIG